MRSFQAVAKDVRLRFFHKQIALAAALGCAGSTISQWESGTRFPSRRKLEAFAGELGKAGAGRQELKELFEAYNHEQRQRQIQLYRPEDFLARRPAGTQPAAVRNTNACSAVRPAP